MAGPARARPGASFDPWLARWGLVPDGTAIATRSSDLLPVRRAGVAAMLKVAFEPEERSGAALMSWWAGEGAAQVLEHEAVRFARHERILAHLCIFSDR